MIEPDIRELIDRAGGSRYALVVATARRARMLVDGDAPRIELAYASTDKPVTAAVNEIYQDKVEIHAL